MNESSERIVEEEHLIQVYRHFYEEKKIIVPDDSQEFDFLILDECGDSVYGVSVHVENGSPTWELRPSQKP